MKTATDFWTSKAFWLALIGTVGFLYKAIVIEKKWPDEPELIAMLGLWMAVFVRDAVVKGAEGRLPGQPANATPVTMSARNRD